MKESVYKTYDDLPLFLNANLVAQVLGVSPSSGYELMHLSLIHILIPSKNALSLCNFLWHAQ